VRTIRVTFIAQYTHTHIYIYIYIYIYAVLRYAMIQIHRYTNHIEREREREREKRGSTMRINIVYMSCDVFADVCRATGWRNMVDDDASFSLESLLDLESFAYSAIKNTRKGWHEQEEKRTCSLPTYSRDEWTMFSISILNGISRHVREEFSSINGSSRSHVTRENFR